MTDNITKLQTPFEGRVHQVLQALDPDKLDYIVIAFKNKDETVTKVTWSDMTNGQLCHALMCLENDVKKNVFGTGCVCDE